jgi:hypothetical protein
MMGVAIQRLPFVFTASIGWALSFSYHQTAKTQPDQWSAVWPKVILKPLDAEIKMQALQRLLTAGNAAVILLRGPQ